jgi:hypothetical protein
MLTDRDKKVLSFIEKYGALTIQQASTLFFNNLNVSCTRRLLQLERQGLLKSYTRTITKEKAYYICKKKSHHDLYVMDFIKNMKKLGFNVRKLELTPKYLQGKIIPDAYIQLRKGKDVYLVLLEIDYSHYTSNSKMKVYEELYKSQEASVQGVFPSVVIARPTPGIRYNSYNFRVIYTDLEFSNLDRLLLV